jgi:hypothetical protein
MNQWAHLLAEAPASLQRLIARTQRISLPRQCSPLERLQRLRQALGHAATVRQAAATLDADTLAVVQVLRHMRGGITTARLVALAGPIRPWRAMAADPRPQCISEHLILLGWLLPRPATPRHPAHWLMPAEVRRWLPRMAHFDTVAPAPAAPHPPILRAMASILMHAAIRPLALQRSGLRAAEQRLIGPGLVPIAEAERVPLLNLAVRLCVAMGLQHAARNWRPNTAHSPIPLEYRRGRWL